MHFFSGRMVQALQTCRNFKTLFFVGIVNTPSGNKCLVLYMFVSQFVLFQEL